MTDVLLIAEQAQQIEEAFVFLLDEAEGPDFVSMASVSRGKKALATIRSARAQKQERQDPKPPKWYTREEIIQALGRMNYCDEIAQELADWFVLHLQHAFNKGFQVSQELLEYTAEQQERFAAAYDKAFAKAGLLQETKNRSAKKEKEVISEIITEHDQLLRRLWCVAYEEGRNSVEQQGFAA